MRKIDVVRCTFFGFLALLFSGCSGMNGSGGGVKESSSIPKEFHGTWTWNEDGVHPAGGEDPWTISAKSLGAHESSGKILSVEVHGASEIVVKMEVFAEGERYEEENCLKLSSDGNVLTIEDEEGHPIKLYRVKG